jgi:hypothetical protein
MRAIIHPLPFCFNLYLRGFRTFKDREHTFTGAIRPPNTHSKTPAMAGVWK